MNFRFFFVIASCFVALLCNAQVQVSTKQLIGTKWEATSYNISGIKENPSYKNIKQFDGGVYYNYSYYLQGEEPSVSTFRYYVSDTTPSDNVFNDNYVGTERKGRYIVYYNDKTNETCIYTIISFNDDEIVLHNKTVTTPALDCYVTYKRVK